MLLEGGSRPSREWRRASWAEHAPAILARAENRRRGGGAPTPSATCERPQAHEVGVAAARWLSDGQDAIIRAIFRFACEHLYPSANPHVAAERLSVIATGGYGAAILAPG